MSLRLIRFSALLPGLAAALVGCGGGGGGDGPSSTPPVNQGPQLVGHNRNQLWYRG